jgi:hypothetical protein
MKSQNLDKSGISWNDFPTIDEKSFLESLHLNRSETYSGKKYTSQRDVMGLNKSGNNREPNPYQIYENGGPKQNDDNSSRLDFHDGMKSITFNNGQKVYRKSYITKPNKNDMIVSKKVKENTSTLNGLKKSPKKEKLEPIKIISSQKKETLNIIETPKKPIFIDSKNQKISVTRLLTEVESIENDNEDDKAIQQKLDSLTKTLNIKETTSLGNSKLVSDNSKMMSDNSSIIMKSDFTDDPISRRSLSPIKSIRNFCLKKLCFLLKITFIESPGQHQSNWGLNQKSFEFFNQSNLNMKSRNKRSFSRKRSRSKSKHHSLFPTTFEF